MLVPMSKVRILGRRDEVDRVVDQLHRLGLVEIADARGSDRVDELGGEQTRATRREQLRLLAGRVETLLGEGPVDARAEATDREPPGFTAMFECSCVHRSRSIPRWQQTTCKFGVTIPLTSWDQA